jgi:hypothetical protein
LKEQEDYHIVQAFEITDNDALMVDVQHVEVDEEQQTTLSSPDVSFDLINQLAEVASDVAAAESISTEVASDVAIAVEPISDVAIAVEPISTEVASSEPAFASVVSIPTDTVKTPKYKCFKCGAFKKVCGHGRATSYGPYKHTPKNQPPKNKCSMCGEFKRICGGICKLKIVTIRGFKLSTDVKTPTRMSVPEWEFLQAWLVNGEYTDPASGDRFFVNAIREDEVFKVIALTA